MFQKLPKTRLTREQMQDELIANELRRTANLTNSQAAALEILREEGPTYVTYINRTDFRAFNALIKADLAFVHTYDEYGCTFAAL